MISAAQCHQRWAVFISGTGSNLQALIEASVDNFPVLVVSSSDKAPGLGKARRSGIHTLILPKVIDWYFLKKELKGKNIFNIFLLGFMKIIPQHFVEDKDFKILNLHPSLLPNYPGLRAFERAFADNAPLGATVHKVVTEVDAGQIIKQKKMQKNPNFAQTRLSLSFLEQSLVKEVWAHESF